jgi:hypothetical protein
MGDTRSRTSGNLNSVKRENRCRSDRSQDWGTILLRMGLVISITIVFIISTGTSGKSEIAGRSDYQAVPAAESSHRNRKKCRPQREHRYGRKSRCSNFSMAFRTPTLRKSTDLQCGHREENIPYSSAIVSDTLNRPFSPRFLYESRDYS